jgi:hypothetical protein
MEPPRHGTRTETPRNEIGPFYRTAAKAGPGLEMRKISGIDGSPTMEPQIQPLGGGLRDMVPAPRGIRAVGDGA